MGYLEKGYLNVGDALSGSNKGHPHAAFGVGKGYNTYAVPEYNPNLVVPYGGGSLDAH